MYKLQTPKVEQEHVGAAICFKIHFLEGPEEPTRHHEPSIKEIDQMIGPLIKS